MNIQKWEKKSLGDFDQTLIDMIENLHPETLEEAVRCARLRFPEDEEAIVERLLRLESEGKISFEKQVINGSCSFTEYLFSGRIIWFWFVLSIVISASVMVFVVPENAFPIVYVRYIFGSVFVLFLPGYCFIKAFFASKELDHIEQFALSIVLSLVLVPLVTFLLNYTTFGISNTTVIFCLIVLTMVFAFAAVVREYVVKKKIASINKNYSYTLG